MIEDPQGLAAIAARRCEILSPQEMGQADALAAAQGMPVAALMEQAGRAVARAICRHFPPSRVLVLAGPGNNGGDGYVAARYLAQAGWPVAVATLGAPRPGSAAAAAAARWRGPMVAAAAAEVARADLVIDAVLGAGLTRELDPAIAALLQAARRIVAVDLPSGLDGATGAARGAVTLAAMSVTFCRLKPGHVLLPGREVCGRIVLADIGLPEAVLPMLRPRLFANHPGLWDLPARAASDHKYRRGHVSVLAGAEMTGAARLAASAARRAGAGLVSVIAQDAATAAGLRTGPPGLLVSDAPLAALLADPRRNVFVCGPGLGAAASAPALAALIAAGRMIVGDADVFSTCEAAPDRLRGATVLTPHAGEFARVFGPPGADRVAAARAAAARTGAVVVLKGADTIIAAPDGRAAINVSAPPSLATAGAGDVLAGLIAALLAQGMAAWQAASAGVWLHGTAASLGGPASDGLIAEDVVDAIPAALAAARS